MNEEQFREIFRQWKEAALLRDVETDMILEANKAAERLYGRTHSEFLTLRIGDLAAPSRAVRRMKDERRREGRLLQPHHRDKTGRVFPIDCVPTRLRLRGRRAELWTIRDASAPMRIKGRQDSFLNDLIHELRSPLAVIQGFTETLRERSLKPPIQSDCCKRILNQANRMGRLIDRLLDLNTAKRSASLNEAEPVSLAKSVWDIVSSYVPLAERRGISIAIDVEQELLVKLDYSDLNHIFGNLIDNAIKYNRRRGTISIRGRADGETAILSVQDTGIGIPAEDADRIFERLYRSGRGRSVKGTGLGLSIVRRIVEANGGRIWAESAPGAGTVFHVALPASQAAHKEPQKTAA